MTNGALRIDESTTANGHKPPSSPLLTIMVMTWLGATRHVQSQSLPRAK